jgi:SAM-dependent methyltransferase
VNSIVIFLTNLEASLVNGSFRKLTLGKFRGELDGVEHIYVRQLTLKLGIRLNFVIRYPDHDVTQNHPVSEGLVLVRGWLGKSSWAATLFTTEERQQLLFNRRGEPRLSTNTEETVETVSQHDRAKLRRLKNETFLQHLGILTPDGTPNAKLSDKYRQIHHFIELLAPALRSLPSERPLRIVDMGSGKGYLTFAAYAFLEQQGYQAEVVGIERRPALVDLCNQVAAQCEFVKLRFEVGEISAAKLDGVDVVIALHACDTATDDAIFRGISAKAQLLFLAPCCHKEIRPQLIPPANIAPLFKHGIQSERMAEGITDALRCMYLEASGYSTNIQEFVALEHSKKNLLISASRNKKSTDYELLFQKASDFQALFGITHQHLANLLALNRPPK